jgi:hypothetical protein
VPKAHSLAGFFIGCGAICHALLFGVLSEFIGVDSTLVAVMCMHAVVLGVAWHDGFSQLEFYESGYDGNSGETKAREQGEGNADTEDKPLQLQEHGAPTPALALLRTWKMGGVLLLLGAFMFCGMAMKMLLSTVFEQVGRCCCPLCSSR